MKAEIGTPLGSSAEESMTGHWLIGAVKRAFGCNRVRCQPAVERNAERFVVFALIGKTAATITALSAHQARRDDDAVAFVQIFHAAANRFDGSDKFVSEYGAGCSFMRGRHGKDIQIGAAQAARFDAQ